MILDQGRLELCGAVNRLHKMAEERDQARAQAAKYREALEQIAVYDVPDKPELTRGDVFARIARKALAEAGGEGEKP